MMFDFKDFNPFPIFTQKTLKSNKRETEKFLNLSLDDKNKEYDIFCPNFQCNLFLIVLRKVKWNAKNVGQKPEREREREKRKNGFKNVVRTGLETRLLF